MQDWLNKVGDSIFQSMGRQVLTLSLEGSVLSLLMLNGNTVVDWLTIPFNPRLVIDGTVNDPTTLSKVIRNSANRIGWSKGRVIAAYPGERLTTRVLALPPIQVVKPDILIPREARRLVGTVLDYQYLYWTPIKTETGDGSTYYMLAVSRTELNSFMQSITLAGLELHKIETRALASTRAVGVSDAVIVNLGIAEVEISIVNKFIPDLSLRRTLKVGLGVESLVQEVVKEIRNAITRHNEMTDNSPLSDVTPVYLVGRNPQITEGLSLVLQSAIGRRPVRTFTTKLDHPPDFPKDEYSVNVGLALSLN